MQFGAILSLILGALLLVVACTPAAPPSPPTAAAKQAPTPIPTIVPAVQPTTAPTTQPTLAPTTPPTPAPTVPPKPAKGGQLTVGTASDPTTVDPVTAQDLFSDAILALTTDSLFEVDDKGQVVGRLVEKVDSPHPNVYVLTLRSGVKFHDGTDLNSAAVKFNLERHIHDPKAAATQGVDVISAIDAPDPLTVQITLDAPSAAFTSHLTTGAGFIQSPAAIRKLGDKLQHDLTGAGSGPFKFVSWEPDKQIVLERNPDYWARDADGVQLPYLDRVVIKPIPDANERLTRLKSGDVDMLLGNPPYSVLESLQQSQDITVLDKPGLGFEALMLNTTREPFTKPAVRRALAFAIDRDLLRQTLLSNRGASLEAPVTKSIPWAYLSEYRPYAQRDPISAKRELTSINATDVSFIVQIAAGSPKLQHLAELVRDQVNEVGFTISIQPTDAATLAENAKTGDFQAQTLEWSGAVDPDGDIQPLLQTDGAFNFARYSNPQVDKLLEDGRTTLDQSKRASIYKEAQKLVLQDEPLIVLYSEPQLTVLRKSIQNAGVGDLARVWLVH